MSSKTVPLPRDIKEMAIMVLADRKMQGYTQDDLLELRDWIREASANMDDLRAYLERECQPIRDRIQRVNALVEHHKDWARRVREEAERKAA